MPTLPTLCVCEKLEYRKAQQEIPFMREDVLLQNVLTARITQLWPIPKDNDRSLLILCSFPLETVLHLLLICVMEVTCRRVKKYDHPREAIKQVPTDIPPDTEVVNLHHNSIGRIPAGSFSRLSNCTELDIAFNYVSRIEAGAFTGLVNLQHLKLYGNRLQEIRADMWEGLDSLPQLSLHYGRINTLLPGAFSALPKLKILNLRNNNLSHVEGNQWDGLCSLQQLDLSTNKLTHLGYAPFSPLSNLKELQLYSNKMVKTDRNTWAGLISLEKLDLRINDLTSLPSHSFSMYRSLFIDLSFSEFVTFPREIFGLGTARVITLCIDANPMNCDSRLCWLKRAEREGWIVWNSRFTPGYPQCENYPRHTFWPNIELICSK